MLEFIVKLFCGMIEKQILKLYLLGYFRASENHVNVHIWTPPALLGAAGCAMCYSKSNFPWMRNKASDLTYNLEAHKEQKHCKYSYGLAKILL